MITSPVPLDLRGVGVDLISGLATVGLFGVHRVPTPSFLSSR